MQQRQLGAKGPRVSALGLGCMAMSGMYGPADRAESIATIHAALEAGITLLDTGDFYGLGHNEMLIGEALRGATAGRSARQRQVRRTPRSCRRLGGRRCEARGGQELPRLFAPTPGARSHRHLSPGPPRSEGSDRGDGRCHGRAGSRRLSAAYRPLRGRLRRPSAGRQPCIRSAISRSNIRSSRAASRTGFSRPAGSSASPSPPMACSRAA